MSDHSWQNGDWEDDGLTDDLDLGELADLLESDTPQRKSDVPLRVSEKAMNVPAVKDDKKVRPRRRSRLGNPPKKDRPKSARRKRISVHKASGQSPNNALLPENALSTDGFQPLDGFASLEESSPFELPDNGLTFAETLAEASPQTTASPSEPEPFSWDYPDILTESQEEIPEKLPDETSEEIAEEMAGEMPEEMPKPTPEEPPIKIPDELYAQVFGDTFGVPEGSANQPKKSQKPPKNARKTSSIDIGTKLSLWSASVVDGFRKLTERLGARTSKKTVTSAAPSPLVFDDTGGSDPDYVSDTVRLVDVPSPTDDASLEGKEQRDADSFRLPDDAFTAFPDPQDKWEQPTETEDAWDERSAVLPENLYPGGTVSGGEEPLPDQDQPDGTLPDDEPVPVPSRRRNLAPQWLTEWLTDLRRRLPSFKPKVYTIPPSDYVPEDDTFHSPTLVKEIEAYIARETDLGEMQASYERMRDFILSVSTDAKLTGEELQAPPNLHQVAAAQEELFDLIDEIGRRNEEQRERIGVYETAPEQDPYNYRGINDNRQNYDDIEAATFSLDPQMDFESQRKISTRPSDGGESDGWNALGGEQFIADSPADFSEENRFSRRKDEAEPFSEAAVSDGEAPEKWDDDLGDIDEETLPKDIGTTPEKSYDEELADDFERYFEGKVPKPSSRRRSRTKAGKTAGGRHGRRNNKNINDR
ncbi:MAG: hypothetical protein II828_00160 [Clostridia bacterium]|nr:hypothetical protein [Clostridia bacterium]